MVPVNGDVEAQIFRQIIVVTITQHIHVVAYQVKLIIVPVMEEVHMRY